MFGYFAADIDADADADAGVEEEGCMWEQRKQCECDAREVYGCGWKKEVLMGLGALAAAAL